MNRNKATHKGHCQACNRIQMLPAGVLAKHGYEVAGYGFFNGVCMGAGHKPLEQDKSIVEASIKWAQERITSIEETIKRVAAEKGVHFAWFHVYKPGNWQRRRSEYKWEYCPVAMPNIVHANTEYREGYICTSEGMIRAAVHLFFGKSTQELCDAMNAKYIEDRQRRIKDLERYIKDQQHRIKVWHAQPLIPVEAV